MGRKFPENNIILHIYIYVITSQVTLDQYLLHLFIVLPHLFDHAKSMRCGIPSITLRWVKVYEIVKTENSLKCRNYR